MGAGWMVGWRTEQANERTGPGKKKIIGEIGKNIFKGTIVFSLSS